MDSSERKQAEQAYTVSAFDYPSNPVGSRDWTFFWEGWQLRATITAESAADGVQASDHGCGKGRECWCEEGREIAACEHRKAAAGVLGTHETSDGGGPK